MSIYNQNEPYIIEVAADETVYLCKCGHSKNPPYCDGSHNEHPGQSPVPFHSHEKTLIHVCGCGLSAKLPFCDGSHSKT